MSFMRLAVLAASLLAAMPALSHTDHAGMVSLRDGFLHPFGGIDHLLVMVAVGAWTALAGGRALWVWPLAFLVFMLGGGTLALAHIELPAVESAIALSVIALGAAITFDVRAPVALGAVLCAIIALFHGHAHGAETVPGSAAWAGLGFMSATCLLNMAGIALTQTLLRLASAVPARIAGTAVAAVRILLAAT